MSRILAAADIGSNTAHLLIGETDGHTVTRIINKSEWLGLGETVVQSGAIGHRYNELVAGLKRFSKLSKEKNAENLYVFATEAVRVAKDSDSVMQRLNRATGLEVHIIDARQEAQLSLTGCRLDSPSPDLMIEVGGGSVQIAEAKDFKVVSSVGLPIGTGRLSAETGLFIGSGDEALARARRVVDRSLDQLGDLTKRDWRFTVACGGVARGLWRCVHPDGEKRMRRKELEYIEWCAAHSSDTTIAARFGLKGRRVASLLPGALVYGALMDRLNISEFWISEFGVREGALIQSFNGAL